MAVNQFNLAKNQRAERKLLITVAEWTDDTVTTYDLQTSQPANWTTNYTSYYIKSGDSYVAVTGTSAPTWVPDTYYTKVVTGPIFREILGTRTEDSSIEYNTDIQTSTDIRGFNYTDVNKTQPQQSFDPFLILGGSFLGAKLNDIRKRNAYSELSQFTLYIITAYVGNATDGYSAEKHTDCTIEYTSLGGDANVNMPINAYFSNRVTAGKVDKLDETFVFTPDVTV